MTRLDFEKAVKCFDGEKELICVARVGKGYEMVVRGDPYRVIPSVVDVIIKVAEKSDDEVGYLDAAIKLLQLVSILNTELLEKEKAPDAAGTALSAEE